MLKYWKRASRTIRAELVNASSLASGHYSWSMSVIEHYSGSNVTHSFTGSQDIRTAYSAAYGSLWAPVFVDRLIVSGAGALWEQGRGNSYWFSKSGSVYTRTYGEPGFSTLVYNSGNSTYTLTSKTGDALVFDATGRLTTRLDTFGNETAYTYTDGDGDSTSDEVATITDPAGRVTTWAYSGNKLASITDFAGRATTITITGGQLLTITSPDPDAGGPQSAPVMAFGYNVSTGLLETITNAESEVATISYHTDRTVDQIEYPDLSTESYDVPLRAALVIPGASLGSSGNPATAVATASVAGEMIDRAGESWAYAINEIGFSTVETDPNSDQTITIRNHEGLPVATFTPDPDGAGPLTSLHTYFHYDANGNLLIQHNPDNSVRTVTYDSTWNVPLTVTDENGHQTIYDLDPGTGAVLSETRVIGLVDPAGSETNDIVTQYTYQPAPTIAGDLPGGLLLTMTDGEGFETHFTYYSNPLDPEFARLYYRTEAVGTGDAATVFFDYDTAGNLTSYIDELSRETVSVYDDLDRLIETTLPDPDAGGPLASPVYAYEYDGVGRLTLATDALLRDTQYVYNAYGQLYQVITPDHDGDTNLTVVQFGYDSAGRQNETIDANGYSHTLVFDELGRVIERHEPSPDGIVTGPVYATTYGPTGLVLSTTDPLTNVTNYEYENFGRKVTTKQPNAATGTQNTGPQFIAEYDSVGNLVKSTDPLGRFTLYAYDELNRLTSVTAPDPDGVGGASPPVTAYTYDKRGLTKTVTDALTHVTTSDYNGRGWLTQVTYPDPDGVGGQPSPVVAYDYDDAGQLILMTDAMTRDTTYAYDGLGRLILTTAPDPDGIGGQAASTMAYEYDAVGNLKAVEDALGHRTEYAYDDHNNRITATDAYAKDTTFTYDDIGNLLTTTDRESNTTTLDYDHLNRLITDTNEHNDSRHYEYDLAGNLTQKTDRNGLVTQYQYDRLQRLTAELWKSGMSTVHTISYGYDDASQLQTAGDGTADYDYDYDGLGRVTQIVTDLAGLTPNVTLAQGYNAVGDRTSLATTIGSTADSLNSYTYDNLDRMTRVTQAGQGGGNAVAEKRADFVYNAMGQFDTITRYEDTAGTKLVATTTFGYDDANRLTDMDHAKGGSPLAGFDIGYDEANRITSLGNTQHSAESATVGYDDDNRVTSVDRTGSANDEAYSYLDNGNRNTANGQTYAIDPDNQIQSDGVNDYIYDAEGNRLSKENISTHEREEYTYDYRNRLASVTFKDGGGNVVKVVQNSRAIAP